MSIRFTCPECGKRLETADQNAGRGINCPRCGQRMTIPRAIVIEPQAAAEASASEASVPPAPPRIHEAVAETSLTPPAPRIDFEELIDMTAMVDIVFFLLIFFLVTSMHALDSTIPMPTPNPDAASSSGGGGGAADADEDSSIVVNIDRNNTIRIEGTEIIGPRDLLFKLQDLRQGPGRPDKLLVVGHGDASHGTAVMVLDAGHEVGMESVKLAVRDEVE